MKSKEVSIGKENSIVLLLFCFINIISRLLIFIYLKDRETQVREGGKEIERES